MSKVMVTDTFYNQKLIICNDCKSKDIIGKDSTDYNCSLCDRIEKAKHGINFKPTTEMIRIAQLKDKFKNNQLRSNCASIIRINEYKGIKIGQVYGDIVVRYFVGTLMKNRITNVYSGSSEPTEVILECPHCNYYGRIVNVQKMLDNLVADRVFECSICHEELKKREKRVKEYKEKQKKHNEKITDNSNNKIAEHTVEELQKDRVISRGKLNIDKISVSTRQKLNKIIANFEEANPTMRVNDIETNGRQKSLICNCSKCGIQSEISLKSDLDEYTCPGCLKLKETGNYIGAYKLDRVGEARNLLELVNRDMKEDTCTIRCCLCKQVYNNIPFYEWYSGKIICNCEATVLKDEIQCPHCYNWVTIKYKDVIQSSDKLAPIKCDKCGKEINETPQSIIDSFIEIPSRSVTLSNRLKVSRNKLGNKLTDYKGNDNELVVCKDTQYVGTDGEKYHNCRCLLHGQDMILNETEISLFNHEQCEDKRQHIVTEITRDNIKLGKV